MKPAILSDKTVVVAGGSGLVGSALVARLGECGAKLVLVGRNPPQDMPPGATFVQADLRKAELSSRLPGRANSVIHLAQSRSYKQFPESAVDIFDINISATYKLLDYAFHAGVESFVYTSSGGLYKPDKDLLDEDSPLRNPEDLDAYYLSKLTSELLVRRYDQMFRCVTIRPFSVYGPNQQAQQMIPQLFGRVRDCKPVYLRGSNGESVRPLHAQDLADAIISAVAGSTSGVFNISGPDIMTVRELVGKFSDFLGVSPIFEVVNGEPLSLICSNRKVIERLHQPRIQLSLKLSEIALN